MAWNDGKVVTSIRPKIAILMPNVGGVSMEFCNYTWTPITTQPTAWCDLIPMISRAPSLPLARNILVENFLKNSDAEYALWLDSDVILEGNPPNYAEALLKMFRAMMDNGKSIVSGVYRAKQQHGFNYALWKKAPKELSDKGYVHVESWTGNWFQVDVVGLGFVLMRRQVLQDIYDQTQKAKSMINNLKSSNPQLFKGIENCITFTEPFHWESVGAISEDFWFLERAAECGHQCWVLGDIKLSHSGNLTINCDVDPNKSAQVVYGAFSNAARVPRI